MTEPDNAGGETLAEREYTAHGRLMAEVQRRLEVAKAATPGPWSLDTTWLDVVNSALLGPVAGCSIGTGYRAQSLEDARHIALHDPDDAVRRYEADLDRLGRHLVVLSEVPVCLGCAPKSWPCLEVLSLAASLGIAVAR